MRLAAEKYVGGIFDLCAAHEVPLLNSIISQSPAYPASCERHEPLAFSSDRAHEPLMTLVKELEDLAAMLGLVGGGKR